MIQRAHLPAEVRVLMEERDGMGWDGMGWDGDGDGDGDEDMGEIEIRMNTLELIFSG